MNIIKVLRGLLGLLAVLIAGQSESAQTIDEIVVTADFRGRSTMEIPASISVLDSEQIDRLATQHFEELIGLIPNLNWSGDGHRARYFQIRGVGELEHCQATVAVLVGGA